VPFHIVIAGDFAGANPERPSKPLEVDRDNLEAVLARVRPRIELPLAGGDGKPLSLEISDLDSFHPDRLYRRLPLFEAIRATVTAEPEPPVRPPDAAPAAAPAAPAKPAGGGFLDDILASTEERYSSAPPAPALGEWDEALHRIATTHAQPKQSAQQERREADAQKASTVVMRAILHSPQFRTVENAWRGLDFVTRRVDTDSDIRVWLLDISKAQLAARLAKAVDDEWSVVLANYTFGPGDADISALRGIAQAGASVHVPVIAAAHPMLLGCESAGDLSDPAEWRELPEGTRNTWTTLRRSAGAGWIGLVLPRVLMRLPYGADSSPCEEFPFEEMGSRVPTGDLAWASPVFACAALLGQSWMDYGEAAAGRDLDGMLSYSWREDGESRFQPAGEALLTDRAAEAILERGLIPLLSSKYGSEIRIPRFQSLADPPVALEFPGE
jgi:type VI secretion system protein ImpC